MKLFRQIACLLIACVSCLANAASIEIAPVLVDLPAGRATDSIRIMNRDLQVVSVQVRVYKWSQVDGEDQLEATSDVQLSPPLFTLAPGASQTVRLLVKAAAKSAESSYRLWIDQIPVPDQQLAINFKFRVSMPIFMAPAGAAEPRLEWSMGSGPVPYIEVVNHGNRRAKFTTLNVATPDGTRIETGLGTHPYVLANSIRRFPLTLKTPLPPHTPLQLTVTSELGRQSLTIDTGVP